MNKQKLLILTSDYGDGHKQAAKAIQQATKIYRTDFDTVIVNIMEWVSPHFHTISRYLFIQGVKKFPSVYSYLYQKTKNSQYSFMLKTLNMLSMRKMRKLIMEVQPSIIVSTFPLAAAAISLLKSYGISNIPTVTIITDHTDHNYWIHPYTNHYIVGSEKVRNSLVRSGIPYSRVSVTGIPIRDEFGKSYSRELLIQKYQLNPRIPTVLIMGGGFGIIGDGNSSLTAFEKIEIPIQIIIVCGHNEKLKRHLEKEKEKSKHHVTVTGYVDYIYELMAISDILVTKPGGVTISEAMAMELPMLLYKPLPGQEEDNATFLMQANVAVQVENIDELQMSVDELLRDHVKLKNLKDNFKQFHAKKATYKALEVIFHEMETYEHKEKLYG